MALTKITPQMFDTSAAGHDFNIDNGTFVVDASANRVGIGTSTPSTLLDVNGTATATTFVGALTGNVTGNVSGTAATVTGAAQTNITSLGTLTALTVSGDAVFTPDNDGVRITGANYATLRLEENDTTNLNTSLFNSGGDFVITTSSDNRSSTTDRFRLDHATGDIGFYNTAGSSQSFFWDASAGSLTISGDFLTSSGLKVAGHPVVGYGSITGGYSANLGSTGSSTLNETHIYSGGTLRAVFNGSGNVGIGETNPLDSLSISSAAGNAAIRLKRTDTTIVNNDIYGTINFAGDDSDTNASGIRGFIRGRAQGTGGGMKMEFHTAGGGVALVSDPRMTLNADGNLGIGDASPSEKFVVKGDGARMVVSSADMEVAMLGRRGSSGTALDSGYLRLRDQGSTTNGVVLDTNGSSWLNGGNVGIGTSSPSSYYAKNLVVMADGDGTGGITIAAPATDDNAYLAFADGTSGAAAYAGYVGYSHSSEYLFFGAGAATAMYIKGGNVGIGESDNSGYLAPDLVVVAKSQNGGITVKSSSTSHAGTLAFADATSGTAAYDGYIQYEHNNRALTLASAGSEAMRINSSGNVGIGESSPLGKLHVKTADSGATVDVSADELVVEGNGNTGVTILSGQSYSGSVYFGDAGVNYDGYIAYSQAARKFVFGAAAGANTVEIDSTSVLLNGIVTKPEQSAFSATRNGSDVSFNANTTTVIPFQSEIFDQSADYNASNYHFTAPVTGKYQFNLYVRVNDIDESSDYYILYIRTSNRNYYHILDPGCFDSDPNYYTMQVTVLADMDSGDQAWGEIYQTNGANQSSIDGGNGSNSFSGYLVA